MSRHKIPIDAKLVLRFAQLGCTIEEISDYFQCSRDTIERRFAAEMRKGRVDLRMSLRQMQIKAAERGNIAMLIWLGKQMLGQSDKAQIEQSGSNTNKVQLIILPSNGREKKE